MYARAGALRPSPGAAIPTFVLFTLTAIAVIAIFMTTDAGRRLAARLGVPNPFRGGVDRETRDYLLEACGRDKRLMAERLQAERDRFPALDEAAIYRRAVRTLMNERGGPVELD